MGIPGCDIIVPDRPVDAVAHLCRCYESVVAPALTRPAPDNGLASNLVAADPIKRLILGIGMVVVFNKEMRGILAEACGLGDERILLHEFPGHATPVWKIPWMEGHGRIVLKVF